MTRFHILSGYNDLPGYVGLPHMVIPVSKLESGGYPPVSGLIEAQLGQGRMPVTRSSLVPTVEKIY